MFNKEKISIPLILSLAFFLVISCFAMYLTKSEYDIALSSAFNVAKQTFEDKKLLISSYFKDSENELINIASNQHLINQIRSLDQDYQIAKKNDSLSAYKDSKSPEMLYLDNYLGMIVKNSEYDDMLVINSAGDVIYSVSKGADFATNLSYNSNHTHLDDLYSELKKYSSQQVSAIASDYERYTIKENKGIKFIAATIPNCINSEPCYLLSSLDLSSLLALIFNANYTEQKFHLFSNNFTAKSYNNTYGYDVTWHNAIKNSSQDLENGQNPYAKIDGLANFTLLDDVEYNALNSTYIEAAIVRLAICFVLSIAFGGLAYSRLQSIYRDISKQQRALEDALNGEDLSNLSLPQLFNQGSFIQSLEKIKSLKNRFDEMHSNKASDIARVNESSKRMKGFLKTFASRITSGINAISVAISELQSMSVSLSTATSETNVKTGSLSTESAQTSGNVQTFAGVTIELTDSIKDISQKVEHFSDAIRKAVVYTYSADDLSGKLLDASRSINSVIETIQELTEQIHLLSLNATIESARAGEAGKGFAVVANEVRNLAQQTSQAADDTVSQIQSVQSAAEEVIKVVMEIKGSITAVNEYSGLLTDSVAKQRSSSSDVNRKATAASQSVININNDIQEVSKSVSKAERQINQMQDTCKHLTQQADMLNKEIADFIISAQNI